MEIVDLKTPEDVQKYFETVSSNTSSQTPKLPIATLVSKGNQRVMSIYITEEIISPAAYLDIVAKLYVLAPTDIIEVVFHTPGGSVLSAALLSHVLSTLPNKVIGKAYGNVISSGTLLFLACDEVDIADDATFMFHGASGGVTGKISFIESYCATFSSYVSKLIAEMVSIGMLTDDEAKQVIEQSKDVYIPGHEIKRRLNEKRGVTPNE